MHRFHVTDTQTGETLGYLEHDGETSHASRCVEAGKRWPGRLFRVHGGVEIVQDQAQTERALALAQGTEWPQSEEESRVDGFTVAPHPLGIATRLGTVFNAAYQAGQDADILRSIARGIRAELPEHDQAAFTDSVEMCGLWLDPIHAYGMSYTSAPGDTFAGAPLAPGTRMEWDDSAGTHYPAGRS